MTKRKKERKKERKKKSLARHNLEEYHKIKKDLFQIFDINPLKLNPKFTSFFVPTVFSLWVNIQPEIIHNLPLPLV